jgi:hypothetical protein
MHGCRNFLLEWTKELAMSNIIEFLEQLGQDSRLRNATGAELQAALAQAGVEPALRTALAERHSLETQLGVASNPCCLVYPAEESDEGDASVPAPSFRDAA